MAAQSPGADCRRPAARIIAATFLPGAAPAPEVGPADWPCVAQAAEREGIAPLLHAALKALERSAEPPGPVRERLRNAYLLADTGNWLAYRELAELLADFRAEEIPVVLLKGCALAAARYPEPALRPMGDLDVLIAQADLERAAGVFAARGYAAMAEMAEGFGARYLQEKIFVRQGGRPAQVDVHWHLTSMPYYRRRIPIAWFWERTAALAVPGAQARVFAPEAQLLHLSLHFALHHWAGRLLWSFDLALLLVQSAHEIDWGETARAARAFGLSGALHASLEQVREWWGVAPPERAAALLAAARPGRVERLLLAVMSARRREVRILSDGLSLPGARAMFGYWLELLFPSPAYMRQRYRISSGVLLPFYYLGRLAKGAFRLARSIVAVGLGALRAAAQS